MQSWKQDGDVQSDKVILLKNVDGEFIRLSIVDDYKYRLYELSYKSLYDWIQIYKRLKHTKSEQKKFQSKKPEDVKQLAVIESDEEIDTDFKSNLDYLEPDQALESHGIQGKYAFL